MPKCPILLEQIGGHVKRLKFFLGISKNCEACLCGPFCFFTFETLVFGEKKIHGIH
jgi:hypothetical protein